jgi:DNA-binding beta-propeller fold protein YncE
VRSPRIDLFGQKGGSGSADSSDSDPGRISAPIGVLAIDQNRLLIAAGDQTLRFYDRMNTHLTTIAGRARYPGGADGVGAAVRFSFAADENAAGLGSPAGLAWDGTKLYVGDTNNRAIRAIDLDMRTVETFAGMLGSPGNHDDVGTAARFGSPMGLSLDGAGSLYVSDANVRAIRVITLADRMVRTLVTTSTEAPFGIAYAPFDQRLYVTRSLIHIIDEVDPSGTATIAHIGNHGQVGSADNGQSSGFDHPTGLTIDGTTLVVADTLNHTLRRIDPSDRTTHTIAGTAGSTGSIGGVGRAARFKVPLSVSADAMGQIFVADYGNSVIRRFDGASGAVTVEVGLLRPALLGSGNGPSWDSWFDQPFGLAADSDGNLYVAESGHHRIRKIDREGVAHTFTGTPTAGFDVGEPDTARFNQPRGLVYKADPTTPRLYVTESGNHSVRFIDLAGDVPVVAELVQGNGLVAPTGITIDPDTDTLYVSDPSDHTVWSVSVNDRTQMVIAGVSGRQGTSTGAVSKLAAPIGVAFDSVRHVLYVADANAHVIRMVDLSGPPTLAPLAGQVGVRGSDDGPVASATFFRPTGLLLDDAGGLWVCDRGNSLLRKIDLDSMMVSTPVGQLAQGAARAGPLAPPGAVGLLNRPYSIARFPNGDFAIGDEVEPVIERIRVSPKNPL